MEPVEDAAEFSVVHAEHALEPPAEVTVTNFVGVLGRDGGDEIGIDDSALHQVDRAVAVVVSEAIVGNNVGRAQTDLAQDMFAVNALVAEVVQSETNSRMPHPKVLI